MLYLDETLTQFLFKNEEASTLDICLAFHDYFGAIINCKLLETAGLHHMNESEREILETVNCHNGSHIKITIEI